MKEEMLDVTRSPTALKGLDVLHTEMYPLGRRNGILTHRLQNLIIRAQKHFIDAADQFAFLPERGLMTQLRELEYSLRPGVMQRAVNQTYTALQNYFKNCSPADPEENDGQVLFFTTEDKLYLFVSIVPPRLNGSMPTVNRVEQLLQAAGVHVAVEREQIESIMKTVRSRNDVVWYALLAQGKPSVPARLDQIELAVPVIDKGYYRKNVQAMKTMLKPSEAAVKEGQQVGRVFSSQSALEGMDIHGNPIPPPEPEVEIELSDEIRLDADGTLRAQIAGCVMRDGRSLFIQPAYIISNPGDGGVDVHFNGSVVVMTNLSGPGQVECDDLYVLGNCEQLEIKARGDVFVCEGVVGHHKTMIDADGGIYAGFVSEARLTALREVVVSNAIINSQVVSNERVQVTSPKGMVAGGKLMSLQEIIVPTIGSEFGMLTETVVGRDFLSRARLEEIEEKIRLNEENLKRIEQLKTKMARSRTSIDQMPPAQQEIFIGVLRKERASQEDLKVLQRRKTTLEAGIENFLEGSIRVLDNLYPPVRVQIGDAETNIRERFHAVRLTYNSSMGIVSEELGEPKGETGHDEEQ
jgi:hypothetical protein